MSRANDKLFSNQQDIEKFIRNQKHIKTNKNKNRMPPNCAVTPKEVPRGKLKTIQVHIKKPKLQKKLQLNELEKE